MCTASGFVLCFQSVQRLDFLIFQRPLVPACCLWSYDQVGQSQQSIFPATCCIRLASYYACEPGYLQGLTLLQSKVTILNLKL